MRFFGKTVGLSLQIGLAASALLWLTACETLEPGGQSQAAAPAPATPGLDILRVSDPVIVTFAGVANSPGQHSERVLEDGTLTLPFGLKVKAEGKTRSQLQKEIYDLYVPKYYQPQMTITVQTENRFYWVNGEVRQPNRIVFSGETTVMRAIASAGGFTDFANRKKVRLTRANGEKLIINCDKALSDPSADRPVYPGDRIDVVRRII
jgi:polysaccharide export outer membrane protein